MPSAFRPSMLVCAALLAFSVAAEDASAKDPGKAGAGSLSQTPVKKKQSAKTVRHAKPPVDAWSRETVGQRSARLQRECHGAANAGACAGYTR